MTIEKEVFKKSVIDYEKLMDYGFKKTNDVYIYETIFLDNSMKAIIKIKNDDITGNIIDLATEEEYTNFRLENNTGNFSNSVKEEYIHILKSIKDKCAHEDLFIMPQSNRITNLIKDKYDITPEFLWVDYPDFGIFRNKRNQKWFGLIMNIPKEKLIKNTKDNIDVLNIKLDKEVPKYIKIKGIFQAYHMNKSYWVTIILDDTLTDEYIMDLINKSYELNNVLGEWLVPANPKYFDIANAFNNTDTIIWKQSTNILKDDIVYIYAAAPYSCIMYKCLVIETDIPYEYKDKNVTMQKVMKLKRIKKYDNEYSIDKLEKYGIKSVRGPRNISQELKIFLDSER